MDAADTVATLEAAKQAAEAQAAQLEARMEAQPVPISDAGPTAERDALAERARQQTDFSTPLESCVEFGDALNTESESRTSEYPASGLASRDSFQIAVYCMESWTEEKRCSCTAGLRLVEGAAEEASQTQAGHGERDRAHSFDSVRRYSCSTFTMLAVTIFGCIRYQFIFECS